MQLIRSSRVDRVDPIESSRSDRVDPTKSSRLEMASWSNFKLFRPKLSPNHTKMAIFGLIFAFLQFVNSEFNKYLIVVFVNNDFSDY